MATAAREIRRISRSGSPLEPTPVIADDGADARVIVVYLPAPPAVGDRFTFDGLAWEVVHAKDHTRGCVARPWRDDSLRGETVAS